MYTLLPLGSDDTKNAVHRDIFNAK